MTAALARLLEAAVTDPAVALTPAEGTVERRDLGERAGRLRWLDLHPLTFGRWRVSTSDARWSYGRSY